VLYLDHFFDAAQILLLTRELEEYNEFQGLLEMALASNPGLLAAIGGTAQLAQMRRASQQKAQAIDIKGLNVCMTVIAQYCSCGPHTLHMCTAPCAHRRSPTIRRIILRNLHRPRRLVQCSVPHL